MQIAAITLAVFFGSSLGCQMLSNAPSADSKASPTLELPSPPKIVPSHLPTASSIRSTPTIPVLSMPSESPLAEWEEIPVLPSASAGEELKTGYAFIVKASQEEVQSYYQTEMEMRGWSFLASGKGATGAVLLIFTKGQETVTISIIPQADGVMYVLLVK